MMKQALRVALFALAAVALIATEADGRRLGGGRSFGTQRDVAPRQTPAAAPAQAPGNASAPQPTQPANANAGAPAKPQAPTPSGASRWLAPLAGIAAGLGLAALLSHFGLSEQFGGLLLLMLFFAVAALVLRRLFARAPAPNTPLQFAGAGTANPAAAEIPASAAGSATFVDRQPDSLPPDFDEAGFLKHARIGFNRLQAAFDRGDRRTMADMMTAEMYGEIARDLDERGEHRATEVVKLDADVSDVATEREAHWASVRFSGLLREDGNPLPHEFEEIWNLTKPVDGSHGWLLAGIQQVRGSLGTNLHGEVH